MSTKFTLSARATELMYEVRTRLKMERQEKHWPLRVALARSIQAAWRADTKITPITTGEKASGGKKERFEIELVTFEQKDGLILQALLNQYYGEKLDEATYTNYLRRHIEHGLQIIYDETQNFTGYEYLVAMARNGTKNTQHAVGSNGDEPETPIASGYSKVIPIRIGLDKVTGQPHIVNFNKTDEHSNNYVGVIGKPGSGKTYFVKHLLQEIRKNSHFETNFIIFDYAKGDIADDPPFTRATRAELIEVDQRPIPINVFYTEERTPKARKFAAERLVSIVKSVEASIGKVQETNLFNAIVSAYDRADTEGVAYPDFQMVREALEVITPRSDSLTSVFRPLTEHNLFATRSDNVWSSLTDHTVIFDIHRLPASKDLCVFFILNELYRQLMQMPDSRVDPETKAREMRTVVVIDEAHHFLKSKKRVQVLENMIREIRSKGASVMLLSQSPDDYEHADFNFLELLEFVYVLGCNVSSSKFLEQSFGIPADRAKKLMQEISQLKQGEAFGKSKERNFTQLLLTR